MKNFEAKMLVSDKPVSMVVQKGAHFKVIAIGLNKEVSLKKHVAPGITKLLVLKGQIEYKSEREDIVLDTLDEYVIPLEEVHEVTAKKTIPLSSDYWRLKS